MKTTFTRWTLLLATLVSLHGFKTAALTTITTNEKPRTVIDFDRDWRFSKGDFDSGMLPGFDDSNWRQLNLPHDWSIEEPLQPDLASATGFAPGGIGWYRKTFRVDESLRGKLVAVEFDGVYNHAQVWINGHFVGGRPYGYSSFECDLTPLLKYGDNNVLSIRVDHTRYADSRWYTGSGIYRNVRLRITNPLRIAPNGIFVTTPEVSSNSATIRIETAILDSSTSAAPFVVATEILDRNGAIVGSAANEANPTNANQVIIQSIRIPQPQLWSVDSPTLYTARIRLTTAATRIQIPGDANDRVETHFGIRTIRFDANTGFYLNDVSMKLKGVCLHHEAGSVGAAVPIKVWERRLRTLKEIGVNAIRTSHNPPAPEFLDLCDRMGFLVKDEAFDEFTPAKNKWVAGWNSATPSRFGYAEDFEQWSVRDIQDMVRRDRNHPSIILWSIGNEIDYANDPFSHPVLGDNYRPENPSAENLVKLGRPLVAAVKEFDTTRPVTAARANVPMSDAVGFGELLDVDGYNYQEQRYAEDHAKFPKRILYGSETSHRYDSWLAVRENNYIFGQFLWTGIDYLGEASRWPNHGSSAGLLDTCGFKKPLAWWRQSLWSDQPMVYISAALSASETNRQGRMRFRSSESWNWPANSKVTVRCVTTCQEVQLALNGKILGTKHRSDAVEGTITFEIPFEPGTLSAIGREGDKTLAEFSLKTAGTAHHVELLPDTERLAADGKDISHVEFRIVDEKGNRVTEAANPVTFSVEGRGVILGIDNGDLNSTESSKDKVHRAFHGRGLLILQSTPEGGSIRLKASSQELKGAEISLSSR